MILVVGESMSSGSCREHVSVSIHGLATQDGQHSETAALADHSPLPASYQDRIYRGRRQMEVCTPSRSASLHSPLLVVRDTDFYIQVSKSSLSPVI